MNRTQLACYALIASAIMLTAMLFAQSQRFVDSTAKAEMVVHKDFTTMLTTRYTTDSELVYVLDSKQGRLVAYLLDNRGNGGRIELMGGVDLNDVFQRALNQAGPGIGGNRRAPR